MKEDENVKKWKKQQILKLTLKETFFSKKTVKSE